MAEPFRGLGNRDPRLSEKLIIELNAPNLGVLGRFCLFGRVRGTPWPDMDLLTNELRAGLEQALENCILHRRTPVIAQPDRATEIVQRPLVAS